MKPPVFLVTNDDGVDAPGIRALAAALRPLGHVLVVAPDREMSACAQSLTLTRPVEARPVGEGVFAVNGTPADCVTLALQRLLSERPDVLLSGINRGANLGDDVFYSGTVGAAREGVFCGIPSLALSLVTRAEADFSKAAAIGARLAERVLADGLPGHTLLNVNVPVGDPTRAVITVQGRRSAAALAGPADPVGGASLDRLTDVEAVQCGLVSVTPLQTDTTHYGALARLSAWDLVFRNGHGK